MINISKPRYNLKNVSFRSKIFVNFLCLWLNPKKEIFRKVIFIILDDGKTVQKLFETQDETVGDILADNWSNLTMNMLIEIVTFRVSTYTYGQI